MINFNWDNTSFNIIFVSNGVLRESIANHSHSKNSFELHYVSGGSGAVIVNGESYPLTKGCYYVTGGGIYHEQLTNKGSPLEEWCVYIQSCATKSDSTMADMFFSVPFFIGESPVSADIFATISKEYESSYFGYETIISGLMTVLLTQTVRLYNPDYNLITPDNIDLNNKRLYLIECEFLYHAKELTLTALSEKIGVCERQTQRILKQYYGMTFREKRNKALNKYI